MTNIERRVKFLDPSEVFDYMSRVSSLLSEKTESPFHPLGALITQYLVHVKGESNGLVANTILHPSLEIAFPDIEMFPVTGIVEIPLDDLFTFTAQGFDIGEQNVTLPAGVPGKLDMVEWENPSGDKVGKVIELDSGTQDSSGYYNRLIGELEAELEKLRSINVDPVWWQLIKNDTRTVLDNSDLVRCLVGCGGDITKMSKVVTGTIYDWKSMGLEKKRHGLMNEIVKSLDHSFVLGLGSAK